MRGKGKSEIEIKLRVSSLARLRAALARAGARKLGRVHEMNTLFDTPHWTLRKKGRLLRLRVERPAVGRGVMRGILTMKGPAQRGGRYKVREEAEAPVAAPQSVPAILGTMGLRATFRYEKYRTSYGVPSAPGLHLVLDETPMGTYLELEGPPRAIDRVARRLGYSPADYITRSYLALHLEDCRRRGVRAGDLVFPAKKK